MLFFATDLLVCRATGDRHGRGERRPGRSVRHSPDDQPLTNLLAPNLTGRVFVDRRSSWLCLRCNYSAICIKQLPLCVLTLALVYADVTKPFLTRFSPTALSLPLPSLLSTRRYCCEPQIIQHKTAQVANVERCAK